ncbi:hypothetical protein [Spirosoma areae]
MKAVIEVNKAIERDIHCKANRSFSLNLDVGHSTIGKGYKLEVRGFGADPILTFEPGDQDVLARSVNLYKSMVDMDVMTGCYSYDLVEIEGNDAVSLFTGSFVIEPGVSTIVALPIDGFPYDFDFDLDDDVVVGDGFPYEFPIDLINDL